LIERAIDQPGGVCLPVRFVRGNSEDAALVSDLAEAEEEFD
jgi:hypothetical protein